MRKGFTWNIQNPAIGFTWNIQNPAISSLSSGNGPSMTVRLPADITPAFASSVLGGNLPECRGRQDWP